MGYLTGYDVGVAMTGFFVEKYKDLPDEPLLRLAQEGHGDAVLCLIGRYAGLARLRAASLAPSRPEDLDDLTQEGLIAVYAAIRSYDFSSASFSTFARLCIDRAIVTALRKQHRKKQIPESHLVPMDAAEPVAAAGPETILLEREAYDSFISGLKQRLSDLEYQVLTAYLAGRNYKEIAAALALKPKAVDNAMARIRQKLK